jgi:AraC-like DNA-binding protein
MHGRFRVSPGKYFPDYSDISVRVSALSASPAGRNNSKFLHSIGTACFWTLILFLIPFPHTSPRCATAAPDTIPPSFEWISPAPFSVITTNTIRLAVDARDNEGGSGIEKVVFYARYFDFNNFINDKNKIGEVTTEPYEFIWDCSSILDQNLGKLSFACDIIDKAGNISPADVNNNLSTGNIVLDRKPELNTSQLRSMRTSRTVIIDGDLNEWAGSDSIFFTNNDNGITIFSLWDSSYLYFAARIMDRCIISTFAPGADSISGMPGEDDLEIYMDTRHTHSCILELPSRQFLFSPAGMSYEVKYTRAQQYLSENNLRPNIVVRTKVSGTLNNERDNDSCYVIEAAIPWKELGLRPKKSMKIGLEIWNADRDFMRGNYSYAGWTTTAANLKNPSEWGDLVLVETRPRVHAAVILPVALGGLTVVLYALWVRRRKHAHRAEQPSVAEKEFIHAAREYIAEHFRDETLSRETVAGAVGLTPSYFGKEFKKETGIHFSEYLMNFRIEKAKTLLLNSRKSVSEITFEVGFNSQSYFGYVFRKATGLTPKHFRDRACS